MARWRRLRDSKDRQTALYRYGTDGWALRVREDILDVSGRVHCGRKLLRCCLHFDRISTYLKLLRRVKHWKPDTSRVHQKLFICAREKWSWATKVINPEKGLKISRHRPTNCGRTHSRHIQVTMPTISWSPYWIAAISSNFLLSCPSGT